MSITLLKDADGVELSSGIVAIHAALVPTPTGPAIVYFGTADEAWRFDPGALDQPPVQLATKPGWWAFCSAHAFLNDGRWIIGGGVVDQNVPHHNNPNHDSGERRCEIYAPRAGSFSPIHDFNFQPEADYGGGRWYPTVLSLANGEVLAVGGHPFGGVVTGVDAEGNADAWDTTGADDYEYAPGEGPRHNNNTPERYSPVRDRWTLLTAESTSNSNIVPEEYPRLHLAPSGHVFFSTLAKQALRYYDPMTGTYDGTSVAGGSGDYHHGSDFTSVLLPILPSDLDNVWVLACGAATAEKINMAAAGMPTWEPAGSPVLAKARHHACAVLLPTGSVFLNGGEVDGGPELPAAELYHPSIDWDEGRYESGGGSWEAIEAPLVKRGYHNVALLLPDGRVWIAGSTWSDWSQDEHRMEVYTPPYIVTGRVEIDDAPPSVGYGASFDVELSSSATITRVVLIRCGSVTHAFDGDQRYVVCSFRQTGSTLTVTAPEGPGIAPPGNYMLFVLDSQLIGGHGRPCMEAAILRVCDQECIPVANQSTYSKLSVDALASGGIATFTDAVWLFLENFLPHEANYPAMPALTVRWDSTSGATVDSDLFRLVPENAWAEDATAPPDVAQRFALRYSVRVHEDVYEDVNVQRDLFVTWDFGHFECTTMLRLTTKPNPYMVDVEGGNDYWLSTDLRAFTVREGAEPPAGALALGNGENPFAYLDRVLEKYNQADNDDDHPFRKLEVGQDASALELRETVGGDAVYNFAIAKVRYVAQGENAPGVRVLFRMFNTVGTALEFDTRTTYRRHGTGQDAVALLGNAGATIVSIPFFAVPRVTPWLSMTSQPPDATRTLEAQGATEFAAYFGAWLDVNQTEPHIPPFWFGDGPYPSLPFPLGPESILALVRNYHQCVIAEVHFADDPIPDAADPATQLPGTPANNDNLAQRNLAWVPTGNPGSAATRTAQTTFVARPSGTMETASLLPVRIVPRGQVLRTRRLRRRGPDELIFDGSKLPAGSRVTVYLPDVAADEVLALAARRASPVRFRRVDPHTVSFELRRVAYLPLPGGREAPIPGLLSVELPPGIQAGEGYRLVVHQLSGAKRRVIGTFQLQVPVFHEPDLLEGESIKLSLLRWVFERIPAEDPWRLVFERYLGEIADRVRGFGGEPDAITPSPNGDGYPGAEKPADGEGESEGAREVFVGKVAEVRYDCFGDFVGFVLASCDERHVLASREPAVERLARRACAERLRLAVAVRQDDPRRIVRISIRCG